MAKLHVKESYYCKASTKDSHRKAPALIRLRLCLHPRLFLLKYIWLSLTHTHIDAHAGTNVLICGHMAMQN